MTDLKAWLHGMRKANLAKTRHVFYYNSLTDGVLEHDLQIYSRAQG